MDLVAVKDGSCNVLVLNPAVGSKQTSTGPQEFFVQFWTFYFFCLRIYLTWEIDVFQRL
jgi:hypothetical protein